MKVVWLACRVPILCIAALGLAMTSCASPRSAKKPSAPELTSASALASTLSPGQLDATQGAIVQVTRRVQATLDMRATSDSQAATATAAAQANQLATETAITQATAQAMAAAQASWPPILVDPFADNSLGWPVGRHEDEALAITTMLSGGKYLWTVVDAKHSNSYWNLVPANGRTFSDFYAKVKVEFIRGEQEGHYAYGLVFRHNNDDYGFFGLRNDGRFTVLAVFDTGIYQNIVLRSSAIRSGQANQIGVRAIGSDFVFEINDQPVWRLSEDFPPGEIGLGVEVMVKEAEAQAAFTDFEVDAPK